MVSDVIAQIISLLYVPFLQGQWEQRPPEKPPSFQWMLPRLLSVALQKELRCFLEARFAIEELHQ